MKNRFGTDLTALRDRIMSNQKSVAPEILAQALRSRISPVHVTGLEKWNFPSKENDWGRDSSIPRADGTFDVEGHAWTDINGYLTLSLLNKKHLNIWLNDVKDFIVDIYNDILSDYKRFIKAPKASANYIYTYAKSLSLKRSYWIWTVESFDVLKSDQAEERLTEKLGGHEAELNLIRTDIKKHRKLLEDINNGISHSEVQLYARQDYARINEWMWVQKLDPTIILVDENEKPYDLKSGWSNQTILLILKIWYWYLFEKRISIIEAEKESYNKISKDLSKGLLDVATGNFVSGEDFNALIGKKEPEDG
jgi:hypothetical protein